VARRDEILAFADELLDLAAFPDYGPMGMQVAGAEEVERIACGVSASLELFERAGSAGAQLLIVHHGLLWDSDPRVVDDRMRRRLEALFQGRITLAAYHLALDAHPEVGNNALLARELNIEHERKFGEIGVGGRLAEPVSVETFVRRVRDRLGSEPLVFDSGPERVQSAAVVTGGGGKYLADAAAEGYDLFLTGEAEEPSLHTARELGIHFVAAGHYATERLGVQALAERLGERFSLPWEFIELPNPV
jgi:dinuclear metal center YbgI/SA1388 family protein